MGLVGVAVVWIRIWVVYDIEGVHRGGMSLQATCGRCKHFHPTLAFRTLSQAIIGRFGGTRCDAGCLDRSAPDELHSMYMRLASTLQRGGARR